jgi:quercetin dioxygenase-like cupin family protein
MKVAPESATSTRPAGEHFSGPVWRTDFIERDHGGELTGQRFSYGPGARSFWHVHTDEQALIVVEGRGLIAWEGLEEPQEIGPGDWVYVSPGVPHWHGANNSNVFVHLAVTVGGDTLWLGPVDSASQMRPAPGASLSQRRVGRFDDE